LKTKYWNSLPLSILLLVTLAVSVHGNIYNTYYIQASPISAETPKVILQQGTAGTSTIYMNATSAKVEASASFGIAYGYAFKSSNVRVSTTSGTPVDDSEAVLSIALEVEAQILIIYSAGNRRGSTEDYDGKGCAISIDGVDVAFSWQSPYGSNYADSATSLWYEQLTAGSHTVKGRFFANYAGYTVTISHRQLVALAFPKPANYNYVLKTVNQVADAWKIRLRAYDQSNIGRLSNCTIYLYNGGGLSRQIYIYNGSYSQQFGNWYDLPGSSTLYIAMTASADSTGASYVYSYLEVLIPNTTTYNLMIITFEIS